MVFHFELIVADMLTSDSFVQRVTWRFDCCRIIAATRRSSSSIWTRGNSRTFCERGTRTRG